MKNSFPRATKRMWRLSGSHAGHAPKSVSLSYLCDRSEYVAIPWVVSLSATPTRCSPSADHEVTENCPDDPSEGGSTSAVCWFHGRLGSKINPADLPGASGPARPAAIRDPSGDQRRVECYSAFRYLLQLAAVRPDLPQRHG